MTKADLVERVSRTADLHRRNAEEIVNVFLDSIIGSLRRGEKVELRGFGSFRLRHRKSRVGRNPKTGERVDVPPKMIPYFKVGKELKNLINDDDQDTDS
ncbi:MAG: integration host factor subunit beta [Acidobacteria bacterium]|nr:integration host factor subunit beta [Acidobacteriota bacterium]